MALECVIPLDASEFGCGAKASSVLVADRSVSTAVANPYREGILLIAVKSYE
jgi:hypothetical protein